MTSPQGKVAKKATAGNGKAKHMVVDANALIKMKGSSLYHKAENFWTVEAVKAEIRDSKAREHLEQLPFELRTRQPSAKAMQAVIEFARKTGDFRELSKPDLEILALTYMFEAEMNGTDHLRKEPRRTITGSRVKAAGGKDMAMASVADGGSKESAAGEHTVPKAAKPVQQQKPSLQNPAKKWGGWGTGWAAPSKQGDSSEAKPVAASAAVTAAAVEASAVEATTVEVIAEEEVTVAELYLRVQLPGHVQGAGVVH